VLDRLDLNNFKCFELLRLPLNHLTLLSGSNTAGKSSILQALVLLHQTMREHERSTRLMLNGSAIKLGTVSDVVDQVHGRRAFEIGIIDDDLSYHWAFSGERDEMSIEVCSVTINGTTIDHPTVLQHLLPPNENDANASLINRLRDLTYITAERLGPRELYVLEDDQIASVVGPVGEHAVSVLHLGRDNRALEGLILPDAPGTLLRQVEARMNQFFPGFGLDVRQVLKANAVTLGLRSSDDTDFHRPIHAGFGVTQTFPIIVAALSAKKGDILLVENPEVHLHPAGQALMGQFLANVAQAGVQVIMETHSDHVLNGIRRSVKGGQINAEQVALHFFKPRSAESAQVVSPQLDNSGNIDTWPEGFFDQFDKDMNYFADWGE